MGAGNQGERQQQEREGETLHLKFSDVICSIVSSRASYDDKDGVEKGYDEPKYWFFKIETKSMCRQVAL